MTVRVGVIGVGMIGQDHVRRLTKVLSGASVVAVADADFARAESVASGLPAARALPTGVDVVNDSDVDAVLVASWGPTHEEYVLASIRARKPVFCEKPLATTQEACRHILDAEVDSGRRFVQVGFMRRFDPAYRALKDAISDGSLGAPLVVHCAHRNPSVPETYTSDMVINDTAVHEMDTMRWLLDEEISAVRVLKPRRNRRSGPELNDPLILLMETASGALIDVEASINIAYGYDIRCEVVAENGTAALADRADIVVSREGVRSGRVPSDWRERFMRAYDIELQDWLDSVVSGTATGPTAWDGYAATVIADSSAQALRTGERIDVRLIDCPDFYAKPQ